MKISEDNPCIATGAYGTSNTASKHRNGYKSHEVLKVEWYVLDRVVFPAIIKYIT